MAATLLACAVFALAVGPGRALAQDLYVVNQLNSSVGEYDASTGATVNSAFIPAPTSQSYHYAYGVALSDGLLELADGADNTVTAYNATTGAAAAYPTINTGSYSSPYAVLDLDGLVYVSGYDNGTVTAYNATTGAAVGGFTPVTGLSYPTGLAIQGNVLYVANSGAHTIQTYNATTGELINASFLTGFQYVNYLTISRNVLYVSNDNLSNHATDTISAYDAATGLSLAGFQTVSDPNNPQDLGVAGNNLYVANYIGGTVSEYDATTGATINASFITGLDGPIGLAVDVPEPSTWAAAMAGTGLLAVVLLRRRI